MVPREEEETVWIGSFELMIGIGQTHIPELVVPAGQIIAEEGFRATPAGAYIAQLLQSRTIDKRANGGVHHDEDSWCGCGRGGCGGRGGFEQIVDDECGWVEFGVVIQRFVPRKGPEIVEGIIYNIVEVFVCVCCSLSELLDRGSNSVLQKEGGGFTESAAEDKLLQTGKEVGDEYGVLGSALGPDDGYLSFAVVEDF